MLTPVVIIDYDKMLNNLIKAQRECDKRGIQLRPHFKAHKTPFLSAIQEKMGAIGFTTAKLSEAELLKEQGFKDILVAYPIVTEENVSRLRKLSEGIKVSTVVDSYEGVDILNKGFEGSSLEVYIKIDTGLNRCGLKANENIIEFAKNLIIKRNLKLIGLLTHAGHSYKCSSLSEVMNIAYNEGKQLMDLKSKLKANGIHIREVSVGSTPTFPFVIDVEGVTEVRPGNYIFNDNTQLALKTTQMDNCALTVKATVISKSVNRFIIDAGAKTLGLDKGTHGSDIIRGYGRILEYPNAEIVGLSEEHGIVQSKDIPKIGEEITIIPNHSCVVMNLAPRVFMNKNNNLQKIENTGRMLNY